MDWTKTTARQDEKHLSFGIWCDLYKRFYGNDILKKSVLISMWHQVVLYHLISYQEIFINEICTQQIGVHKASLCVLLVLDILCLSTKLTFVLMLCTWCVFYVLAVLYLYIIWVHIGWVCVVIKHNELKMVSNQHIMNTKMSWTHTNTNLLGKHTIVSVLSVQNSVSIKVTKCEKIKAIDCFKSRLSTPQIQIQNVYCINNHLSQEGQPSWNLVGWCIIQWSRGPSQ